MINRQQFPATRNSHFDFNRVSEYFGFHFVLSDYPREKLLKARAVIETGALYYTMKAMADIRGGSQGHCQIIEFLHEGKLDAAINLL